MNTLNTILSFKLLLLLAAGSVWGSTQAAHPALDSILRPIDSIEAEAKAKPETATESVADEDLALPRVRLSMDHILETLRSHLQQELGDVGRIEISSNTVWRPIRLPANATWSLYTRDSFTMESRGNWFPLVHLELNGVVRGSWRIPVTVAIYQPVMVAGQRLNRGDQPVGMAVMTAQRDILRERGNPVPAGTDLSGYEVVQPIQLERTLTWGDIALRPAIRRGDQVEAIMEAGSLTVVLSATSLEDGIQGQRITLRNPRSRRDFQGIVIAPGRVRVEQTLHSHL